MPRSCGTVSSQKSRADASLRVPLGLRSASALWVSFLPVLVPLSPRQARPRSDTLRAERKAADVRITPGREQPWRAVTVPVCPSLMDKARLLGLNPAVLPPECLVLCERCAVQHVCGQGEETYCEKSAQGVGEAAGGRGPQGSRWCSSISGCLLGKPPCSGSRSFVPQAFSSQGRPTVGSVFCFPKSTDFSVPLPKHALQGDP